MALLGSDIERLTTYDATGRAAPKVAERWAHTPDGLTWRLTIRRGVSFQDGTPLTIADVRDAIREAADSPMMRANTVCLSDVVDVAVEPERDVVVRLRRPCSYLLDDLDADLSRTGPDGMRMGTGPFRLVSSTPEEARFEVNASYYGGAPVVDHVVVKTYSTLRAAWAEMMRGELDLLTDVGPEGMEFLRDQSAFETRPFTPFRAFAVVLNSGRPALKHRDTRYALSIAVNRAELVEQGLKGQGLPADMPVSPQFWALDSSTTPVAFDPVEARRLLSRRAPVTFTCLLPENYSVFERLALLVQRQLRFVGVDMRLETVSTAAMFTRVAKGDFDAALIDPTGGPYASVYYRFWHSPDPDVRWNQFNYRSAPVDAALDAMRSALDDGQFRLAMARFVSEVRNDPPAIFLAWPTQWQAINRRFVLPEGAGGLDALRTIPGWRLRGDVR